jgi:hypothetical protein
MVKFIRILFSVVMILIFAFTIMPSVLVQAALLPDHSDGNDHTLVPGSGTGKEQVIYDQVNTTNGDEKRALGGEQYRDGRFERPFDKDMNYLPYLDIVKSTMQREDPEFIFVTIQLPQPVSANEDKPAFYGLELDTNLDGRSEYLLLASKPLNSEWSVNGVNVWKSSSADNPVTGKGEPIPVTGSQGFDVEMFFTGKGSDGDLAWVRVSPDNPDTVELAFKKSLVGGEKGKFVWRPVTDGAGFSSTLYDLNVSFTLEQAGSPLKDSLFYPLKEVYAVDSTCRVASGYEPTGYEAGLCPLPPPAEKSDKPGPASPGNPQTQPSLF